MTASGRGRRSSPPALSAPSPSPVLSASLVLAVALMHILVVGCVVAGSMTSGSSTSVSSSDEHGAHDSSSVMSSSAGSVATHIAATASDCVMGDHACVFVRADVVALSVAVGLVLAIAPLRAAAGVRLRDRAVVLGRPPPWAVLDHLQLSVIRR